MKRRQLVALLLSTSLGGCGRDKRRAKGGDDPALDARDAVMVAVQWPGAANATLETEVVGPVEAALAKLGGARRSTSRIADGHAEIVEWFVGLGTEDWAEAARSAMDGIKGRLPVEARFDVVRAVPRAALWIAVTGFSDPAATSEFARTVMRRRLERIAGVRGIPIAGERTKARFVVVDPAAACRANVTIDDIASALGGDGPKSDAEMLATVVARAGSAEVRLSDVARVEVAVREPPSEAPVAVGVELMEGVEPSRVLSDVRAEIEAIKAAAPAAVTLPELAHAPPTERPDSALIVTGPADAERARIARDIAIQWRATPAVIRRVDDGAPIAEKKIVLNRERAATLRVEMASLAMTLRALIGGAEVWSRLGTIGKAEEMPTIIRLGPAVADLETTLATVCVRNRDRSSVSLALLVDVGEGPGEAPIHRRDGARVSVLAFDLAEGRSAAEALELARGAAKDLPSGYALLLE